MIFHIAKTSIVGMNNHSILNIAQLPKPVELQPEMIFPNIMIRTMFTTTNPIIEPNMVATFSALI